MIQVLRSNLLKVFLLIALLSAVYSCNNLYNKDKPAKILIKRGNPDDGTLDLKDWTGIFSAKKFEVKAGRTIRWYQNAKEVEKITNIYQKPKPGNLNVFSILPHRIDSTAD